MHSAYQSPFAKIYFLSFSISWKFIRTKGPFTETGIFFNRKLLEASILFFLIEVTPYVFRIARYPLHSTKIPTTENWAPIDLSKPFAYLLFMFRRLVLLMDVPNQF